MTTAAGHILALDQGTSSSRAIVFDRRARPIARAQHELRSTFPAPGWVEQDADEIWRTQLRAGREALAAAGLTAADVAAIGITNQRETTIAWDAKGRPLAPAIVWQDRRTADRCAALRATGWSRSCVTGRGWSSIRTSAPPRWPGCSIIWPMVASGRAPGPCGWEPSTAGSSTG